jgi:homopolymeric O-antigen transport system permease protein
MGSRLSRPVSVVSSCARIRAPMKGFHRTRLAPLADGFAKLIAYRTLVKYLLLKEIKVKSRGTYFGVAWTLLNPLLTIIVYFVIFRYVFRVDIPNFLSYFLIGFLMWTFFSRTVTAAATCIFTSASVVKTSRFPLETLPVATVLYYLFHHVVALAIALPLMLGFWGAKFSLSLIWLAVILGAFVCFTLAVALWLSTIGVFFRDARDILEVGLPILFWATPIFYSTEMAPEFLRPFLTANPISGFLVGARVALLDGHAPAPTEVLSMALWLVVMLGSGAWAFRRFSPRFAEEL